MPCCAVHHEEEEELWCGLRGANSLCAGRDMGELGWEQGVMGGCHPPCVLWHFDSALLWGCWVPTVSLEPPHWVCCTCLVPRPVLWGRGRDALTVQGAALGMLSTGHTEPLEGPSPLAAGEVLTPE